MELSQKQKTFSEFLVRLLNVKEILNILTQKMSLVDFCNFKITDSENLVGWMSKKASLRESFNKQHGKLSQALLQSASQLLYHIHWSLPSQ